MNTFTGSVEFTKANRKESLTPKQKIALRLAPAVIFLALITTGTVKQIQAAEDPSDSLKAIQPIQNLYDRVDYALTGAEYSPDTRTLTITPQNSTISHLVQHIKGIDTIPNYGEVVHYVTHELNPGIDPGNLHFGDKVVVPAEVGKNLSNHETD